MNLYVLLCPRVDNRIGRVSSMCSGVNKFAATFNVSGVDVNAPVNFCKVSYNGMVTVNYSFFTTLLNNGVLSGSSRSRATSFLLARPVDEREMIFSGLLTMFVSVVMLGVIYVLLTVVSFCVVKSSVL